MGRIAQVAWREFTATVATKGFILGVCLPPLIMLAMFPLIFLLMNKSGPRVSGEVAIIDHTGLVAPRVAELFDPQEVAKRNARQRETLEKAFDSTPASAMMTEEQKKLALEQAKAQAESNTDLRIVTLPPDADVEREKEPIAAAEGREKEVSAGEVKRLALAVIPEGSIKSADGEETFETYEFFVAPKLDFEVKRDIERQIDSAIVDARLKTAQYDPAHIRALMKSPEAKSTAVTKQGERAAANELSGMLLPFAFMFLLWIGTFSAGQYLLTSTIEEKSNRVMEVILSAVSPAQLMTGKIIGQMAVGLSIILAYGLLGGGSLIIFKQNHLLDLTLFGLLIVYFFIAFFLIASMMAAIGSAVSSIQEAQSLMMPVMMVLILPMVLWMPLQRNPNSLFAVILSFLPPVSPFVMVLRMAGSEEVPTWQIGGSIVVGIISAVIAVWFASKIFRVGVLMYGKPPSFFGLLKWIRYA